MSGSDDKDGDPPGEAEAGLSVSSSGDIVRPENGETRTEIRAAIARLETESTHRMLVTPAPQEIEALNRIEPGLGTKFAMVVIDEVEHRRGVEVTVYNTDNEVLLSEATTKRLGLVFAGLGFLGVVAALLVAVFLGREWTAAAIVAALSTLAGLLYKGGFRPQPSAPRPAPAQARPKAEKKPASSAPKKSGKR